MEPRNELRIHFAADVADDNGEWTRAGRTALGVAETELARDGVGVRLVSDGASTEGSRGPLLDVVLVSVASGVVSNVLTSLLYHTVSELRTRLRRGRDHHHRSVPESVAQSVASQAIQLEVDGRRLTIDGRSSDQQVYEQLARWTAETAGARDLTIALVDHAK